MLPVFQKSIAFWKVPNIRTFVFLIRATSILCRRKNYTSCSVILISLYTLKAWAGKM